ncbi:helix-turn-helix domain-containing protein [Bradyrhizobium pachyrhizi]|uniref:helix-turn-helix domain-containing protein n=1 Tax=Bradyrhizobium pachyrhizi TaxID=280333 RepID=UPI0012E3C86D
MTDGRLENGARRKPKNELSFPNGHDAKFVPFAERLSCTVDEACVVTGLGRTKVYELIGSGQIITTTIGRRRLVIVRSLLALLDATNSV